MPANAVKGKAEEALWARAKIQAAKQGQDGNYAYIAAIFKKMKEGGEGEKKAGAVIRVVAESDALKDPLEAISGKEKSTRRKGMDKKASADIFWAAAMDEIEKCSALGMRSAELIRNLGRAFKSGTATPTQKNILRNLVAVKKRGGDLEKYVGQFTNRLPNV